MSDAMVEALGRIAAAAILVGATRLEDLGAFLDDAARALEAAVGASSSRGSVPGPAASSDVGRRLVPAVPVEESVTPAYLVCLEDGKKLKMLKRHLREVWNMTPAEYRAKWGLPPDYPMVAADYARVRSRIALASPFGRAPSARAAA